MKKIFNKSNLLICILIIIVILLVFFLIKINSNDKNNDVSNEDNKVINVNYRIEEIRKNDKRLYNKIDTEMISGDFKGIDVSSWQGEINWEKVKASGVDFAMIRCGFRGTETDTIKIDSQFIYNISEANKYGIPVGVYFYSTAISDVEAIEEASYVLNLIKDYEVTLPIAYDFEIFYLYRAKDIYAKDYNNNAKLFMDYIEEHGYQSMLYTNLTSIEHYWNYDNFRNDNIWYAQYASNEDYSNDYYMWQYSDNGRIDGIVGNVDLNETHYLYIKK